MEELLVKLAGDSIFAAVAVYLIVTGRNDSKQREEKLMAHNEGYQRALGEITSAITEMRHDINDLRQDVAELKKGE